MSQYLSAVKYNLRFNLLPHIGAAAGLLILTPVLFGITALDSVASAIPLELSLPFLGVILLTPVYSCEKDTGILDTVSSRKTSHILICGIRILMAMILTALFVFAFVILMSAMESEVTFIHALGSYANAIFLGGLGILASALSRHGIIGYMVPVLYFVMDLMGGLCSFTIFSMARYGTMDGKCVLFIIGICCIAASVVSWGIFMKGK